MRLRAVRSVEYDDRGLEVVSFCGHCGLTPAATVQATTSRVCGRCGLGLVLRASSDVAPAREEPFLVVDATLSVCAVIMDFRGALPESDASAVARLGTSAVGARDLLLARLNAYESGARRRPALAQIS